MSWGLGEETEVQKSPKSFAMANRPMTLSGLAGGGAAINLSGWVTLLVGLAFVWLQSWRIYFVGDSLENNLKAY